MIRLHHLVIGILLCLLASLVTLGVVGRHQQYAHALSSSGPIGVAGVTYRVAGSRPLNAIDDAAVLRALPAPLRSPAGGDVLYGVFISATNTGDRTRPLARRFELIDPSLHGFAPLPLAATSASRYRAGRLPPGAQVPASGSPVTQNLAEQGYPLVFRLPRPAYAQTLTLRIFDPTGRTSPADILVQS
jgi:hypothetical protein